jgi:hypothetical protein
MPPSLSDCMVVNADLLVYLIIISKNNAMLFFNPLYGNDVNISDLWKKTKPI